MVYDAVSVSAAEAGEAKPAEPPEPAVDEMTDGASLEVPYLYPVVAMGVDMYYGEYDYYDV